MCMNHVAKNYFEIKCTYYVSTIEDIADIRTKPLTNKLFSNILFVNTSVFQTSLQGALVFQYLSNIFSV